MSNLIIGVGGTGRGVITWLEYYLKRDFKKLKDKFHLFVIDGPADDPAYEVADPLGTAGKVDFNLSRNVNRSYQLSYDSVNDINAIREGKKIRFISDWLSTPEAKKVTCASFNPQTAGFGMSRVPAKDDFYREVDLIKPILVGLIGGIPDLERIVLVGSLIGGTGAGMLNETAVLIRDILNERAEIDGKGIKLYGNYRNGKGI